MPLVVCKTHVCLSGDTKIALLDGRDIPIRDLQGESDVFVYSYDRKTGEIVPGQVRRCWQTGEDQTLLKITLDNGESFSVTPDHPVYERNGREKKAIELQFGDSLLPLYKKSIDTSRNKRGYEAVLHPRGTWERTHRMVFRWKYGSFKVKGGERVVHHKNFDGRNNHPGNLASMSPKAHFHLHHDRLTQLAKEGKHQWQRPEVRAKVEERMRTNNPMSDPEAREKKKKTWRKRGHHLKIRARNQENNPMQYPGAKERMVASRRDHPLGYHRGQENPFYNPDLIEATKRRMNENNPMKGEGRLRRLDTSAQKRGFIDNAQFIEIVKWMNIDLGMSGTRISKYLGIDKKAVLNRIRDLNHKVVSIELTPPGNTYNLEIDRTHNFALSAGVFVSNCSGHSCYPPRPSASWSPNVFVEGLNVERFGDQMVPHGCGVCAPHGGTHVGSHTVYANNTSIQVIGDPISCGSVCAASNSSVFVDG